MLSLHHIPAMRTADSVGGVGSMDVFTPPHSLETIIYAPRRGIYS